MTILTSTNPTEYLLYSVFGNIPKFRILIKHLCDIDLDISEVSVKVIIEYIKNNSIGWTLANANILQPLTELRLSELPNWLFVNNGSLKYRSVKTINGYNFDQAKSAVQKYIRRAMADKAMYISNDILLLKWGCPGAKGELTNFYNRIKIIYLEDIALGSASMLEYVDISLGKIMNSMQLSKTLPNLIRSMGLCTKTRVYSHIRAHFRHCTPSLPNIEKYKLGKDNDTMMNIVGAFITCMRQRSIEAFYWLESILRVVDRGKVVPRMLKEKHYNSTRSGFLVFEILETFEFYASHEKARKYVTICKSWYKDMKMTEQFLPIFHAVAMYVLEDVTVWDETNSQHTIDNAIHYLQTYQANLLNQKITFDNFIIDRHTQLGKKIGRNNADFALEGSLVSYDIDILPKFAYKYLREKITTGVPSTETEEFTLKVRTQINTSNSKQDVYFATTNKGIAGVNVVVKGPYLCLEQAKMSFKIQNIMKLFPEVNYYNVNMMVLYPNMFEPDNVPLGTRNQIADGTPYYFLVMEDVMNLPSYPVIEKSSKKWSNEPVTDFQTLYAENSELGFGNPDNMSEKALFSLVIQLAFRIAFEIGDMAARNFVRVGDKVYNVDTEDIMVGTHWKWSSKDRELVNKCIASNRQRYEQILSSWLDSGDSYVKRWEIVRRSVTHEHTEKIIQNIHDLLSRPEI